MSSFWNYTRPITREQNIQGLPARRLIDLPADSPCTDIASRVRPNAPRVHRAPTRSALRPLMYGCTRARAARRVFETFVKLPRASHCSCNLQANLMALLSCCRLQMSGKPMLRHGRASANKNAISLDYVRATHQCCTLSLFTLFGLN